MLDDPFHLQRFIEAQKGTIERAMEELKAGRKVSHWMWFVFPQLAGLGTSDMARKFAIASRAEASAYAAHPVLGARLRTCTGLVNDIPHAAVSEIFGYPDDRKFHSSITLFAHVAGGHPVFTTALEKYFASAFDPATMDRLGRM